jgi:hypothetical protein
MRDMIAPGVWSTNVPSSAIARPGTYRTLGGSIVSARKAPSLGIQTPMERARMLRKNERESGQRADYQAARRCGATMKVLGAPCARMQGHKDCHRSAEEMATATLRRRKWAR